MRPLTSVFTVIERFISQIALLEEIERTEVLRNQRLVDLRMMKSLGEKVIKGTRKELKEG